MNIPNSKRKKALLIVDVQPGFVTKHNKYIIKNIIELIRQNAHQVYVSGIFSAEKGSVWDVQCNYTMTKDRNYKITPEISSELENKETILVEKNTKSMFKGDINLDAELKKRSIEEVHVVGLESNDCVMATAFESFDYGFVTYVIEECSEASVNKDLHENAIKILRHVNMTNNSTTPKNMKF